jgi:hypothetical protein
VETLCELRAESLRLACTCRRTQQEHPKEDAAANDNHLHALSSHRKQRNKKCNAVHSSIQPDVVVRIFKLTLWIPMPTKKGLC